MSSRSLLVHTDSVRTRLGVVPVLQPIERRGRIAAVHYGEGNISLLADDPGLRDLASFFMLAAHWKEAIVYVPSDGSKPDWTDIEGPCDLVLAHHSLQLRRSAWKEMRRQRRNPVVKRLNVPTLPEESPYRDRPHAWPHDLADLNVHGNTVFIVANPRLFRHLAYLSNWGDYERSEGDHTHLFERARHERLNGAVDDLTIAWSGMWPK